jgi:hypothetical protein
MGRTKKVYKGNSNLKCLDSNNSKHLQDLYHSETLFASN